MYFRLVVGFFVQNQFDQLMKVVATADAAG